MRVRHSKRIWFVALGVFVAVFLFTFLAQRFSNKTEVEAASLANFDPGYIISDYQMGNYTSMTEAEIQAFLTAKNSCANTNYNYYVALSRNTNYTWHWDNGHFVCLSEERFGDGEVIGSGETVAHIIWQAAQDFKINPKVLIVLLQKETGLITDPIPNNGDYRKATGYGCPDTAACSEKYYGFKNQVRNAAALFRTVLDGGWTNYPLGNNYIQYNPSAACGGSVVNVKNLATSALYRYTPYQPNAGALAAGYGTASCGAYGNRNFYLYFEDWFGGVTSSIVEWSDMKTPRRMVIEKATLVVDAGAVMTTNEWVHEKESFYFTKKIDLYWGGYKQACLQRQEDEGTNKCILMARMSDYIEEPNNNVSYEVIGPILMKLKSGNYYKSKIGTEEKVQKLTLEENLYIRISKRITINGKEYYQTTHDSERGLEYIISAEALDDDIFEDFVWSRNLTTKENTKSINLATGEDCISYESGETNYYIHKIKYNGEEYYQNKNEEKTQCAVEMGQLEEVRFENFIWPRQLKAKQNIGSINAVDGTTCGVNLATGNVQKYTTKISIDGQVFYRSEANTLAGSMCVVPATAMSEL